MSKDLIGASDFYNLNPNQILSTAEQNGFNPTGELIQLNSYENRVFEIRLEAHQDIGRQSKESPSEAIIAKYYRPGRWKPETLLDEHNFTLELKNESLAVANPLNLKNPIVTETTLSGKKIAYKTLGEDHGIYYAYFEKVRGRLVQEFTLMQYKKIGRWLAQLHNAGRKAEAAHRAQLGPTLDSKWEQLEQLLHMVSPEVVNRYEKAAVQIFESLDEELKYHPYIRIHGDLHRGNILESATGEIVVVDFDDMINGPVIQDFWMLLPTDDYVLSKEFLALKEAYSELSEFPEDQLQLIPFLRGYRIINYAIWIMLRWKDPSFPRLFPNFGTYSYWAEETESLEKILY